MVLLNTAVGLDVGIEVGLATPGMVKTGAVKTGAPTVDAKTNGLFAATAFAIMTAEKAPLEILSARFLVAVLATESGSDPGDG